MNKILSATVKHTIFLELSNGYFVKVTRKNLKSVLEAMKTAGEDFTETKITYSPGEMIFITLKSNTTW